MCSSYVCVCVLCGGRSAHAQRACSKNWMLTNLLAGMSRAARGVSSWGAGPCRSPTERTFRARESEGTRQGREEEVIDRQARHTVKVKACARAQHTPRRKAVAKQRMTPANLPTQAKRKEQELVVFTGRLLWGHNIRDAGDAWEEETTQTGGRASTVHPRSNPTAAQPVVSHPDRQCALATRLPLRK